MSISAENEEAYRSMILKAVQKQTEEQSTGMSQSRCKEMEENGKSQKSIFTLKKNWGR